jgi:PAS domain S-box-containing protein
MARAAIKPTGIECPFGDGELIVTKADLKGHITHANDVFLRVSKYSLEDVIGAPHSLIRHPDMPRCVFKLLWDSLQARKEVFAYLLNMARDGDHYWVLAHVTPILDAERNIVGYHSNRRKPTLVQIDKAKEFYATLRAEESRSDNRKDGMLRGYDLLLRMIESERVEFDEFVFAI